MNIVEQTDRWKSLTTKLFNLWFNVLNNTAGAMAVLPILKDTLLQLHNYEINTIYNTCNITFNNITNDEIVILLDFLYKELDIS